jgi:ABC-2 type transport system permease protein
VSGIHNSLHRIALIAGSTLREAMRQRLFGCFLILAVALVLGARWFRQFNFGAPELRFVADCAFGAMSMFGSALTITATAHLFLGEIENRSVLTLLAKPVSRSEFVLGKFLGTVVLVGGFCVLLTGLLAAVLWQREGELLRLYPDAFPNGRSVDFATLAVAGSLQWLKLAVLASFALHIATLAQTQLYKVVAGFFVHVLGHHQYLAQDAYTRGSEGIGRFVGVGLASVFPNFHIFSVPDVLGNVGGMSQHLVGVASYGFGYLAAVCALAVWSFRHREI